MKRNGETAQMRRNIVQEKSFAFAVRIITASRHLQVECGEPVLSRQLLRSGTSIGANIEEAIAAQSKKDFLAKMSISMKEARETFYWLRLLKETKQNLKTNGREFPSTYRNSSFHIPHSTFEGGGVP